MKIFHQLREVYQILNCNLCMQARVLNKLKTDSILFLSLILRR